MPDNAETPEVVIESDYEGYFEALVREWIKRKQCSQVPFKHTRIVINAGPWRAYTVTAESKGDTLHLDFYAALRRGFGGLSHEDAASIVARL